MLAAILTILSLVLMEAILSIDNAAVLATMVKHLPADQRDKALKYGIIGAYVFRGLFLFIAAWLIKISWIKILGGGYLLYLAIAHFVKKGGADEGRSITKGFWATVVMVEVMDIIFSLDNVLAAVALSPKLWVVMTGVFIGILAMRFVASAFVKLMEKHPQLETSAYLVIGMLGLKLVAAFIANIMGWHGTEEFLEGHVASAITSGLTLLFFIFPLLGKSSK